MFLTEYLIINPSSQTLVITRSEVPPAGAVRGAVVTGGVDGTAGVEGVAGVVGAVLQADVSASDMTTSTASNKYKRKCCMMKKSSCLFGFRM